MATFTKETLPAWPYMPFDHNGEPIAPRAADIRVGTVAFFEDQNQRVYLADKPGDLGAKLLRRYHWRALVVTGETRLSWLCGVGRGCYKFPKKAGTLIGKLDVEDQLWLRE